LSLNLFSTADHGLSYVESHARTLLFNEESLVESTGEDDTSFIRDLRRFLNADDMGDSNVKELLGD
jgi:hypothetical protein